MKEINRFEIFEHNGWGYQFNGHITRQLVSGFASPKAAYEMATRNPSIIGLPDITSEFIQIVLLQMETSGDSLELDLPMKPFDYELAKDELVELKDLVLKK